VTSVAAVRHTRNTSAAFSTKSDPDYETPAESHQESHKLGSDCCSGLLWHVLLNNWSYVAKGSIAAIVSFPLVLIGTGYATEKLTFGKLGNAASTSLTIFAMICIGAVQKYNYEKKRIEGYQTAALPST
jgi:hypothetical protein